MTFGAAARPSSCASGCGSISRSSAGCSRTSISTTRTRAFFSPGLGGEELQGIEVLLAQAHLLEVPEYEWVIFTVNAALPYYGRPIRGRRWRTRRGSSGRSTPRSRSSTTPRLTRRATAA